MKKNILVLWVKILVACIPAVVVAIKGNEFFNKHFYNGTSVSIALIVVGVLFILVEKTIGKKHPSIDKVEGITLYTAFLIGMFQLAAAVFPGVSRSGATILGAIVLGVSRRAATEFTFYLAIPVMLGASLLKLRKFGFHFTSEEAAILLIGCVSAFFVSLAAIRLLTGYVKKHDFTAFGWYRILLGAAVLIYFSAI